MRSWMKKLCADPETIHSRRLEWTAVVASVRDSAGDVWSVATDSKRLLGLLDGGRLAARDPDTSPLVGGLAGTTGEFLTNPVDGARVFNLADVRLWLGPRVLVACEDCQGAGCPECANTGRQWPRRQCVKLWDGGGRFDPQGLSQAVPKPLGNGSAVFGEIRMASRPLAVDGRLADGTRWRAILMPLNIEHRDDLATSPTYVPGIGELWHLRDGNQRGILGDWCQDRGLDIDALDPEHSPSRWTFSIGTTTAIPASG